MWSSSLIERIKLLLKICQKQGCWQKADIYEIQDCFVEPEKEEILKYCYCPYHAAEMGFCIICGEFWGGVTSFDFSRIKGICPNCIDEFDDFLEDEVEFVC